MGTTVSPRRTDPRLTTTLIDVGARLLAEGGPGALSTRRLAAEAGCSTMAVYTRFGGMSGLVRGMVHEGFARLQRSFSAVGDSGDPVADMALLGRVYRDHALTNPHLYVIMFGTTTLGGFSLSEQDRQYGRFTLAPVVETAARCIATERFGSTDAELVAHQMWSAIHGLVTLELGGYLTPPYDADILFESQLVSLMVAQGDAPEDASGSVEASRPALERLRQGSGADTGGAAAQPGT